MLAAIFALIIGLNFTLSVQVDEERNAWLSYADEAVEIGEEVSQLKTYMGYGGFIHHFKNYILRREQRYADDSKIALSNAHLIIDRLRSHELSDDQLALISIVTNTLKAYSRALDRALQEIDRLDAQQLDALVKVDDAPAFQALAALETIVAQMVDQRRQESLSHANTVETVLWISSFASITILVAAFLIASLARKAEFLNQEKVTALSQADILIRENPDGILVVDREGYIRRANETAARMFGYSKAELQAMRVEQLVPREQRADHAKHRTDYQRVGGSRSMGAGPDLNGLRADNTQFPLEISLNQLTDASKEVMTVATIRDVSEIRSLAQQLQRSQRLEVIGKLTGGIAHDFNNILHVIAGNAQLLQSSLHGLLENHPKSKGQLDKVISSVDRGASLTRRLLAFARQDTLSPETVATQEVLIELGEVLQRTLGEHIDLKIDVARDVPKIFADRHQLENAVMNLAINARDAMPDGGVLAMEAAFIELDGSFALSGDEVKPGDYVSISVIDTGDGIPQDMIERVVEPFFTTKDVAKGSGLGLSMVYGFVQQSGGYLNIYSEPNEGTIVRLYLPVSTEENTTNSITPLPTRSSKTGKILVVEDNIDVREIPVMILQSEGFEVVEAGDAKTATDILKKGDQQFDLLFTDIVLPGGKTGLDIAREAKRLQPHMAVIYASGYTERFTNPAEGLKLGENLLRKPYTKAELLAMIDSALG